MHINWELPASGSLETRLLSALRGAARSLSAKALHNFRCFGASRGEIATALYILKGKGFIESEESTPETVWKIAPAGVAFIDGDEGEEPGPAPAVDVMELSRRILKHLFSTVEASTSGAIANEFELASLEDIDDALAYLHRAGWVSMQQMPGGIGWGITMSGIAMMNGEAPPDSASEDHPMSRGVTTNCRCAPPIHCSTRDQTETPATALVCIHESSLDDWWNEQDPDVKANAFLLWTLGATASVHECQEPDEIPIRGIVSSARGDGEDGALDRDEYGKLSQVTEG